MNGIDMRMIENKKGRFISSKEALKDVKPVVWDKKILDGQVKVVLTPISGGQQNGM